MSNGGSAIAVRACIKDTNSTCFGQGWKRHNGTYLCPIGTCSSSTSSLPSLCRIKQRPIPTMHFHDSCRLRLTNEVHETSPKSARSSSSQSALWPASQSPIVATQKWQLMACYVALIGNSPADFKLIGVPWPSHNAATFALLQIGFPALQNPADIMPLPRILSILLHTAFAIPSAEVPCRKPYASLPLSGSPLTTLDAGTFHMTIGDCILDSHVLLSPHRL